MSAAIDICVHDVVNRYQEILGFLEIGDADRALRIAKSGILTIIRLQEVARASWSGMDLSTNSVRLALATKWAAKYSLDRYLVCALIEQESGWNAWAVRFEPAFLAHYVKPKNPETPTTREITLACSFGLCQVMGLVALDLGWRGAFLTELCDPDTGVDFGCRKLKQCMDAHAGDAEKALLAYNGGGNALYAEQVLARVERYSNLTEV